MYQSIPKRVYTTQESAMPKIPPKQVFQEKNNLSKKIPKIETDDLLLIGLLLLLASEEGDNELLMLVVAFLLFF